MDYKIVGVSDDSVSYSLVKVVKAFGDYYTAYRKLLNLFSEPRILLQVAGAEPEFVNKEQFSISFEELLACLSNLRNVMQSFRGDVLGRSTGLAYDEAFSDHIHSWVLNAKNSMSTILRRKVFPEEMSLVDTARNAYFEALALLKEFNALIAMHNSYFPEAKISLVNTADLS